MMQIKKLQELNKTLKVDNERLQGENHTVTGQFARLRTLMVQHEYERIQREQEQDWFFEQLARENDNLKRLLLINHDFTHEVEARVKRAEEEERKRELTTWRLGKLKEEAEQRLKESRIAEQLKRLDSRSESDGMEVEEREDDDEEELSPLTPDEPTERNADTGMPMAVQIMVQQRMEETEKYRKKPEKDDALMAEFNLGGGSRNTKEPLNRTLGKKFANFKTLLDEDEEGDEEDEDEPREEQKFSYQLQSKLQSAVRTNQRAKLSLAQELGALKTEYDDFTPEKRDGSDGPDPPL